MADWADNALEMRWMESVLSIFPERNVVGTRYFGWMTLVVIFFVGLMESEMLLCVPKWRW